MGFASGIEQQVLAVPYHVHHHPGFLDIELHRPNTSGFVVASDQEGVTEVAA